MIPDLAELLALTAALAAGLQLVAAPRRDLGALTVGAAAAAVVVADAGSWLLLGALSVAGLVATWAWSRAQRYQTGRVDLTGAALAVGVLAAAAAWWLPGLLDLPEAAVRGAMVAPCAVAASVGGVLALEQVPRCRRRRRPPVQKIPVE